MDRLLLIAPVLLGHFVGLGVGSCHHDGISGSVIERNVGPGDNITLYCDCKLMTEESIVWLRNCSHEDQPTLVLKNLFWAYQQPFPHFKFITNSSSSSFHLLITNVTHADEGVYYCGTMKKTETNKKSTPEDICRCSNITTRLTIKPSHLHVDTNRNLHSNVDWKLLFFLCLFVAFVSCLLSSLLVYKLCQKTEPSRLHVDINKTQQHCDVDHRDVDWKLLFFLCLSVALVSVLFSSLLVYKLCRKTVEDTQDNEKLRAIRRKTREVEDVCYAALEIRQASQGPKRKSTAQNSDFCTYSVIRYEVFQCNKEI